MVQLNHVTVGTDLLATRLVVHGELRLNSAEIGGVVNLDDAELHHPGGTALHAEMLTVADDFRAMRLSARGHVDLAGSSITRQLNLAYARFSNPGGVALRISSCSAPELWLRAAPRIEGSLNARRARFDMLHITPGTWPDEVRIDGLTYATLLPRLPAEDRLPVPARDSEGYVPYSYEQLAAAYRKVGDEQAARTVLLAKLRRHRTTLSWYARTWGRLQDVTVGYGYRPMRATGWLFALLLTGCLAFGLHHPAPLKADEVPDFNAVFYTLDLLLPIIDFGQQAAFAPTGWYQWLSYLLIVTGWVLATTVAAGVSRTISRQ
jgi:hypothetical protein